MYRPDDSLAINSCEKRLLFWKIKEVLVTGSLETISSIFPAWYKRIKAIQIKVIFYFGRKVFRNNLSQNTHMHTNTHTNTQTHTHTHKHT